MADKTAHELAIELFGKARDAWKHNADGWIADVKFAILEEQWTEDEKTRRKTAGRPCLTINKLPAFCRQVVNDARQNKPAITFHPADDAADPETALILDGLIRNIEHASDADIAYDTALEHAVTGSFGFFAIDTEYACDDSFEQEIRIRAIPDPLTVYPDPFSKAADSSDWNDCFVVEKIGKDEFKKRFPKAEKVDWDQDFKTNREWIEGEEVTVAKWWKRREDVKKIVSVSVPAIPGVGQIEGPEGLEVALGQQQVMDLDVWDRHSEWLTALGSEIVGQPREVTAHKVTWVLMSGAEELESGDWAGKFIPVVPVYGHDTTLQGKRYLRSLIRSAKDEQRRFNYWSTAATERAALDPKVPFIGPKGAFASDSENWATANTENHPYLEYDVVPGAAGAAPQRQYPSGPAPAALQEALAASDNMKSIMGLHDASLGARSNETSGKAIMARQREGDVSTFHFIDNLSRSIRHAGRIILDLIPHIYSTPRILRILGPDKTAFNVAMEPKGAPGPTPMAPTGQPVPQGQAEPPHMTAAREAGINLMRVYDLTAGRYDVTSEAGPSFTTRREEAAAGMVEFMRAVPAAAPVMADILADVQDWPKAKEIGERLKAMNPAAGPNPQVMAMQQQMQQMGQQMEQMKAALDAAQSSRQLDLAKLQLEARKLEIEAFKAQTDRMEAEAKARHDAATAANGYFNGEREAA